MISLLFVKNGIYRNAVVARKRSKAAATMIPLNAAFLVVLSHSSYLPAPTNQPVMIAFAWARPAPIQYENEAI